MQSSETSCSLLDQTCSGINPLFDTQPKRSKRSVQVTHPAGLLRLTSLLPEFNVIMEMYGAGEVTGPQRMAEIGDVRRFTHKGALVAFADMNAPPFQSGSFDAKSRRISRRGSPHLRRTLFQIASTIPQHSNHRQPVSQTERIGNSADCERETPEVFKFSVAVH